MIKFNYLQQEGQHNKVYGIMKNISKILILLKQLKSIKLIKNSKI